jgi:hypothetical protein
VRRVSGNHLRERHRARWPAEFRGWTLCVTQCNRVPPLSFMCGDFFFTQAGVRPGIPLVRQREQDLLWIRDDFLLREEAFHKVFLQGHTPAQKSDIRPNRINIDIGA